MVTIHSVVLSLLFSAAQIQQQDDPQQIELDAIVVNSAIELLEENAESQAKNKASTFSGATQIVNSRHWQKAQAINMKDMLDFIPGVFIQQRNGAESARLSIRGSGLARQFQGGGILVMNDGVPINTADGAFDFQTIDPWLFDFIEVYRGANGMAEGSSALGGSINFAQTLSRLRDDSNQLRYSAGSFATHHALISLGNAKETTARADTSLQSQTSQQDFQIRASHFSQNGFRVQNQQTSNRFDVDYTFSTQQSSDHKLSIYHLNTYAELPSSLSKQLLFEDPTQSRFFNIRGNFHRDLTVTSAAHHYRKRMANNSHLKTTFFYFQRRLDNPVFTYINRDSDDYGMRLQWLSNDTLEAGLYSQWGSQDERRRENELGLPGEERLTRNQKAQTTTAYIQKNAWLLNKKLKIEAALQGVYAARDIEETSPQKIISNRSYSQINPRIGMLYSSPTQQQWYGNVSRSFEAPSFAELNNGNRPGINQPIRAQSADTLELGGRGESGSLRWDISTYYSRLDDAFVRFRFPDGNTRTTNTPKSKKKGLESAIIWRLPYSIFTAKDSLDWQINYQWIDFQLDNGDALQGNQVPGIPEHYLQSHISYTHPSGWNLKPSIEWVPSAYYVDLDNSFKTENYALVNFSFSMGLSENLRFFLEGKNLTDRTYISTSLPIDTANAQDGNYFYSGEGRSFYAGIQWIL